MSESDDIITSRRFGKSEAMRQRIEATEPKGVPAHDGRLVLIFAGTFNEANRWRSLFTTLSPSQVRYVHDGRDLRGRRNVRGVVWGSFWQRRDAHDLMEYAKIVGIEWIDTED